MSEDTGVVDDAVTTDEQDEGEKPDPATDRLREMGKHKKAAEERAADLEKKLAAVLAEQEAREAEGLPELERERKRAEVLEKRIAEAEARAQASEQRVLQTQREQWVAQAAAALNFANPSRAAKLIDDLDSIEDPDQAERAVKRLAKSDSYLVKSDEGQPKIGRVLEGGKAVQPGDKSRGRINVEEEAGMIADQLKQFTNNWQSTAG
jgi:hypothetical protein